MIESVFKSVISKCFASDTAVYPDKWTPERPSTGHCLVVALLVQEMYGGDILMSKVNHGEIHYWNRIDSQELDLTRDQFDNFTLRTEPKIIDREAKLKNPQTRNRYLLLKNRYNNMVNMELTLNIESDTIIL
jgi:hypothetical protein